MSITIKNASLVRSDKWPPFEVKWTEIDYKHKIAINLSRTFSVPDKASKFYERMLKRQKLQDKSWARKVEERIKSTG